MFFQSTHQDICTHKCHNPQFLHDDRTECTFCQLNTNEITKKGRKCFIQRCTQHIFIQLYGVGHMIKDHSDSDRGNPLPPLLRLLFSISSRGSFICTIPQIANAMAFVTPVVHHSLERKIAQWVHHERSIRRHIAS